jgi:hypothetical protein
MPALSAVTTTKAAVDWDTHKAVEDIPESLTKTIEGNDSIRRKFERLLRKAQVNITYQ